MSTNWAAAQSALAAEHAAIWAYGLLGAAATDPLRSEISAALQQHRTRRDAVEGTLLAAGQQPVASESAYQLTRPPDPAAIAESAESIETHVAAAWRYVLGETDAEDIRELAGANLTAAAVQGVRWQQLGGGPITVPAFPGL